MTAKCIDCKLPWNISIKAEIPKEGYKCPKCEAKENKIPIKTTKPKKKNRSKNRFSKVLMNNKQKFSEVSS